MWAAVCVCACVLGPRVCVCVRVGYVCLRCRFIHVPETIRRMDVVCMAAQTCVF
jgi:hypothetical protein